MIHPNSIPAPGSSAALTGEALRRRLLERLTTRREELRILLFCLAHIPLALILRLMGRLAVLHPLAVFAWGLYSLSTRRIDRALYAVAYIAGGEVFWRMIGATPSWEFGKYAAMILLIGVAARMRHVLPMDWTGLVFVIMLLPSILLTIQALGLTTEARYGLSFNLSGPISLGFAALILSAVPVSWKGPAPDLRYLTLALTAPILLIGMGALYSTATAGPIDFSSESNFVTSGGFGPNQVSAMLGLGCFCFLLLGLHTQNLRFRFVHFGLSLMLLGQAILTFSRGGVLNAIVAAAAFSVHSLPQRRLRAGLLVGLGLIVILSTQVVAPRLNEFTGGALGERYSGFQSPGRKALVDEEIQLFRENPIAGVGPGMATYSRSSIFFGRVASHTEYSRLLAEHGTLGLIAILLMIFMLGRAYLRAPTLFAKGWVAAMGGWVMIEMTHAAMRIAAISVVFGFAVLAWRKEAGDYAEDPVKSPDAGAPETRPGEPESDSPFRAGP